MTSKLRYVIASLLIAAVAPMGMAALDLEQSAYAKNGNGGGNGGGKGGGNGGGKGGGKGNAGSHGGGQAKTEKIAKAVEVDEDETTGEIALEDDPSLAPSALGKLNGVLHASPTAIANASANSPIGMAREFGEALAGLLDAETPEEDPEGEPEGEETAEDEDPVGELAELMAGMTNKPVTAAQVEAVIDRLAEDDPENAALQDFDDPDLAQEIADGANEINGFDTGEETGEEDDGIDDGVGEGEEEVALE